MRKISTSYVVHNIISISRLVSDFDFDNVPFMIDFYCQNSLMVFGRLQILVMFCKLSNTSTLINCGNKDKYSFKQWKTTRFALSFDKQCNISKIAVLIFRISIILMWYIELWITSL